MGKHSYFIKVFVRRIEWDFYYKFNLKTVSLFNDVVHYKYYSIKPILWFIIQHYYLKRKKLTSFFKTINDKKYFKQLTCWTHRSMPMLQPVQDPWRTCPWPCSPGRQSSWRRHTAWPRPWPDPCRSLSFLCLRGLLGHHRGWASVLPSGFWNGENNPMELIWTKPKDVGFFFK